MKKLKVGVYAISKNEEKFVNRWANSMKEADYIYVLDTGSTDNTVKLLKKNNINVKVLEIKPWRFDIARNKSLELLPKDTDICVCTDLDEVLEKGWRKKLENSWKKNTTRARYNYNWSLDKNNKPLVNFYLDKIHSRHDYEWRHPVHETLYNIKNNENFITIDDITLNHYPDNKKSRSSYLSLLELSVKEDPLNDRNMHYLGREYMYYQKWNECIDTLIKHLNLKNATWKDERCASMRFIARSYRELKRYDEAIMWANKAIKEAPYLRDPYVEAAIISYIFNKHEDVINYCNDALKIKKHPKTYINEQFSFDETIDDLLSIAYFNLGDLDKSLNFINQALKINKNNKRIIENKKIIENIKNNNLI